VKYPALALLPKLGTALGVTAALALVPVYVGALLGWFAVLPTIGLLWLMGWIH
jgi:hypothetical protein